MRILAATGVALCVSLLGSPLAAQAGGRGLITRAPYQDVVWEGTGGAERAKVLIGTEWFELVSIDGTGVSEIVAVARRNFAELWQKRFSEDLVELMNGMGRTPGETVTLGLRDLTTGQPSTCSNVPMTLRNRQLIVAANYGRIGIELSPSLIPAEPVTGDIC